jgi:hypothetical protein
MADLINVSSIMWANAALDDSNRTVVAGPTPVRPNASIFGLKSQEIKSANERFSSRLDRSGSGGTFEKINIPFQYIAAIPHWTKGANYSEENIMGRFEPLAVYGSSSAQTVKVDLMYHAESQFEGLGTIRNGFSSFWSLQRIEDDITPKLKSLIFPQLDGRFSPPQPLLLNIGAHFIDVPVVVTNIDIDAVGPFDFDGFKTHMRKISVDLRINYPLYQAISQKMIISTGDNTVFSKKEFAMASLTIDKNTQIREPTVAEAAQGVSGFTGVRGNIPIIDFG